MMGMLLALVLSATDCTAEEAEAKATNKELHRVTFFPDNPGDPNAVRRAAKREQRAYDALQECKTRDARMAKDKAEAEAERQLQEREEDLAKRREDFTLLRIAHSARLCLLTEDRRAAVAEIAKENSYAKVAGVVDLSALQALKERVRGNDEKIAEERKYFGRIKPLPCKDPVVAEVARCVAVRLHGCSDETKRIAEVLLPEELSVGAE